MRVQHKDLAGQVRFVISRALVAAILVTLAVPILAVCVLFAVAVWVYRYVLPIVGLLAVALAVVWLVKHG